MISLLETYLKGPPIGQELEARFKGVTPMKGYEYNQIIRALGALGFRKEKDNQILLRIYVNECRVEIQGFTAVQTYCANESLPKSALFIKKSKPTGVIDNDYGMRLALSKEVPLQEDEVETLRRQWATVGKKYRYLNRTRLVHDKLALWAADCYEKFFRQRLPFRRLGLVQSSRDVRNRARSRAYLQGQSDPTARRVEET